MDPRKLAICTAILLACPLPISLSSHAQQAESQSQALPQSPPDFSELAKQQSPAVVAVMTRQQAEEQAIPGPPGMPLEDFFRRFGAPGQQAKMALGSGFVISADGHIVTNNHVVQNASEILVRFSDGSSATAELVGTDAITDIAVLKVDAGKPLTAIRWGDSEAIQPGQWVIAIGNPFGLGGTVTVGVLSGQARDMPTGQLTDLLQTDASINQGNSGGPLFNAEGEVIGVNTAILSPTGGNIGIGFAVPTHAARPVAQQLVETGKVERGYLGVRIQDLTSPLAEAMQLPDAAGALVASVEPDSPAGRAGITPGDVITQVGPTRINRARDLSREVTRERPGSTVEMTVLKDGVQQTLSVELAEAPTPEARTAGSTPSGEQEETARLGVAVAPLSRTEAPEPDMRGVVVQQVVPDSPAAANGVRVGDVIVSANGQPVEQPSDVAQAWKTAQQENRPVLLRIYRDGSYAFLAVS